MRQYHNAPLALVQTLLEIEERAIYYTKRSRGADGTLPPEIEASVLERFSRSFDRVEKLLAIQDRAANDLRDARRHFERLYFDKCNEVEALQAKTEKLLAHEALVVINAQGVLEHSQAAYLEQRYEIDALQERVHHLEHRVEELQARIAELESTNTL